MTRPLPVLIEADVLHVLPPDDEAGFGALRTERGCLPLEAMDVHGRIDGLLSHVSLAQTFVNTQTEPLEATYIFPLPDRAAVTHFRMEVNGRVIDGLLKERGQARQEYDQAIQAGHRAAITEEERPGTFTMRVGNLMPGEKATVRLSTVGPLSYSDGEATFRFPLVVAPRYIPGTPLPGPSVGAGTAPDTNAVPDASRITPPVLLPGFPNPVRLSLTVDVASGGLPLSDLRSSLHAVATAESASRWRVSLQPGERLNRDFILRFSVAADAVKTSLVLKPDADAGVQDGTFLLTVVPPSAAALAQKPRDVVLILDRSGSMEGWKMVAARRALARMVDTLTERDRLLVYAFDDHIETPPALGDSLVPATDRNRFRAVEFLAKIDSRGGTELAQPLERGVNQLQAGDAERDRILVLVTDGQVGNEDQILRNLGTRLHGIRIFTLGVDQAVNEAFLRRLAQVGGGACELVESEDRLDTVMDRVHRRIGEPALTNLELKAVGLRIDGDALVPARLPDLFAGAPLFILGRYRGAAAGSIALSGLDASGRPWTETALAQTTSGGAVPATWARGLIRELEDRYVIGTGDRAALEKRIVETSLQFSVLCRFTAFVAVDRSAVVNAGGQVHQITQPVEAPAGWDMMLLKAAVTRASACAAPMAMNAQSGAQKAQRRSMWAPSAGGARSEADAMGTVDRLAIGSKFECDFDELAEAESTSQVCHKDADNAKADSAFDGYRRRAQDLLDLLARHRPQPLATRLFHLGVVAQKLVAFIEDLRSVGTPAVELEQLEKLVVEVQRFVGGTGVDPLQLEQLWNKVEALLGEFVHQPTRVQAFWK